jgi:hypothetical protein
MHFRSTAGVLLATLTLIFSTAACGKPAAQATVTQAAPASQEVVSYEGKLWRLDNKNVARLPKRFRTSADAYGPIPERYAREMDTSFVPTRKGLDHLMISGSSQYSEKQLDQVIKAIRSHTDAPIFLIDLRQESHGFLNGIPVSWYGERNWGNRHKSRKEIIRGEREQLAALKGKTVKVIKLGKDKKEDKEMEVRAGQVLTEAELAERMGVCYARFTCTDHVWPQKEEIDRFVAFVKNLPPKAWLHFHCEAGEGRTTAFMTFYDMMKNPDVPYQDIVYRQCAIGGIYTPFLGKGLDTWRKPYYEEKNRMIRLFYQYVQENHQNGYETSWSTWLSKQGKN